MEPGISTRRLLPRFSLRSLLLAVCLAGAGFGLWYRWEPWAVIQVLEGPLGKQPKGRFTSSDNSFFIKSKHSLRIWHVLSGKEQFSLNTQYLQDADVSPDGRHLVAGQDSRWKVWDIENNEQITSLRTGTLLPPPPMYRPRVLFVKNGRYVLTIDTSMDVWKTEDWAVLKILLPTKKIHFMGDMPFENALDRLYLCKVDQSSIIWDLSGNELEEINLDFALDHTPYAGKISNSGRLLFLADEGNFYYLYDIDNRRLRSKQAGLPRNKISHPIFSPDDKTILTSSYKNNCQILEVPSLKIRFELVGSSAKGAFSNSGDRVFTIGPSGRLLVWDAMKGQLLFTFPVPVRSFGNSINGRLLFTIGGFSKEVLIWQRRRPEFWWGLAWLWEFWSTLIFSLGLLWSLARDWRGLRSGRPG